MNSAHSQPYPASDPTNTGGWVPYEPLTDEFDGASVDTDKWEALSWTGRMPVYHAFDNCSVSSGELIMTTELQAGATTPVTDTAYAIDAGYLQSTHVLRYGYYEIRMKALDFPIVTTWWLTGGSATYDREIDMFECGAGVSGREYRLSYNFHIWRTPTRDGVDGTHTPANPPNVTLPFKMVDDYHVYGFEWNKDEMNLYVDGAFVATYPTDSFKVGQRLMIGNEYNQYITTLAEMSSSLAKLPATYNVDYVRAWLKPDTDATWYVNEAHGDDSNSGASWADAKKTIGAAIDEAYNGDSIWVAEGVYREYLTIHGVHNLKLYGGMPVGSTSLNEQDHGRYPTIIQAPPDGYNLISLRNNDGCRIDGFTIQGTTRSWQYGLKAEGPSNNVVIANCRLSWNIITEAGKGGGGAIVTGRGDTHVKFDYCVFSNNENKGSGPGLSISAALAGPLVELDRCLFVENTAPGSGGAIGMLNWSNNPDSILRLTNSVIANNTSGTNRGAIEMNYGSLEMTNCTVAGNSNMGIRISSQFTPRQADIKNTIVASNGTTGVFSQWDGFALTNNLFFDNPTQVNRNGSLNNVSDINNLVNSANNVVDDPQLFNLASNDVRIQTGSGAIDLGTATGAPNIDFNGNPRPQGSGIDIGAFEAATTLNAQNSIGEYNAEIPGRVEATAFDLGGEGIAFHDNAVANQASFFRGNGPETEWKSNETTPNIGWTAAGEWIEFTVDVTAGTYEMTMRIATIHDGRRLRFLLDGQEITTATVPNTGSWTAFSNVPLGDVSFTGGSDQVLRVEFLDGGVNYSWVEFFPTPIGNIDDIGTPLLAGSFTYDNGFYYVNGSGSDLFNSGIDRFNFVDQTLDGDGFIVAKVADMYADSVWAKSGIMLRESLATGSKYITLVQRPGGELAFYWRDIDDAIPVNSNGWSLGDSATVNWLAIARRGDEFRGYYSTDGLSWQLVAAPQSLTMSSTLYVGLVATPISASEFNKTIFSEVSVGTEPEVMVPALTDSDSDMIPDDWEIANGLDALVGDASSNPDGDKFTSYEEYEFGTNPLDFDSQFDLQMVKEVSGFKITFSTEAGRNYIIRRTENLNNPFAPFTTIAGTGGVVEVNDTTSATRAFYIVDAEIAP
ncbi:MAG: carbohydrate-binding domain-containing protein [Verrucomicrobiota bacterium]